VKVSVKIKLNRINRKFLRDIFIGGGIAVLVTVTVLIIMVYCYQTIKYPIDLVEKEYHPKDWIKSYKGDIIIYGWKVKRIWDKPNTYLVSYTFANKESEKGIALQGWWWEVNTKVGVVRQVNGDPWLEKKYGLKSISHMEKSGELKVKLQKFKKRLEKTKVKWRKLKRGMTPSQVRTILGEPESILHSPYSIVWIYPNWGMVEFTKKIDINNLYQSILDNREYNYMLNSWIEPHWR